MLFMPNMDANFGFGHSHPAIRSDTQMLGNEKLSPTAPTIGAQPTKLTTLEWYKDFYR
jgi:hypothetical protein